jgi:predicted transcriptional regulator
MNKGTDAMIRTRSVKDLMSPDIMTVPDDMTVDDVARYLTEHEISGTPVVDEQGHLVGVVSMTDIGRNAGEAAEFGPSSHAGPGRRDAAELTLDDLVERDAERIATARDVMTPAVQQVPVTASVAEVARRMVEQHVHRLVVTENKEPVGIVTSMDLLKTIAG